MNERFDLLIRGGRCVLPWGEADVDLGVRDGRVARIGAGASDEAEQVFEARGLAVLPGLIDPHVHLREPGDPAVETIETGTRAALLGGITTVFDMPNTKPPTIDTATLDDKRARFERSAHTDYGIYVGATKTNIAALASLELAPAVAGVKVFVGSSTGDLLVEDDASIEAVMRSGRRRVFYHAEDEYRLRERRTKFGEEAPCACHMIWRDEECAIRATRRIVSLARKTGRPAHILHCSTDAEFSYLRECRDVATVEVLANHLSQVAPECYDRLQGFAVMNPPIRDRRHFEAAWRAVADGLVDTLGSDHAPHPRAAKEKPWPQLPSGLVGVQTTVPVMLTHVAEGRLTLGRLAELMSAGPARVYGIVGKGRIAAGYDADFTLVDVAARRRIEAADIVTPAGWTPYDGMQVTGWPVATIVRGRVAMREGVVLGAPDGRAVRFSA